MNQRPRATDQHCHATLLDFQAVIQDLQKLLLHIQFAVLHLLSQKVVGLGEVFSLREENPPLDSGPLNLLHFLHYDFVYDFLLSPSPREVEEVHFSAHSAFNQQTLGHWKHRGHSYSPGNKEEGLVLLLVEIQLQGAIGTVCQKTDVVLLKRFLEEEISPGAEGFDVNLDLFIIGRRGQWKGMVLEGRQKRNG